jgi:hypothetical protein
VNLPDDEILWVDTDETVGLKLRVRPKEWNPSLPVLVHQDDRDEGSDVAYEVDLEGQLGCCLGKALILTGQNYIFVLHDCF